MPHDTPLIATISIGLALAFVLGVVSHRLRLPPIVGYLLAGFGPFGVGALHDATCSWDVPLIALIATSGVIAAAGAVISRPRTLEDTLR